VTIGILLAFANSVAAALNTRMIEYVSRKLNLSYYVRHTLDSKLKVSALRTVFIIIMSIFGCLGTDKEVKVCIHLLHKLLKMI